MGAAVRGAAGARAPAEGLVRVVDVLERVAAAEEEQAAGVAAEVVRGAAAKAGEEVGAAAVAAVAVMEVEVAVRGAGGPVGVVQIPNRWTGGALAATSARAVVEVEMAAEKPLGTTNRHVARRERPMRRPQAIVRRQERRKR